MITDTRKESLRYVAERLINIFYNNGYTIKLLNVSCHRNFDLYDIDFTGDKATITNVDIDRIKFNVAAELGINSFNISPSEFHGKPVYQCKITNDYALLKTDSLTHNLAMLILSIQLAAELGVINESLLQRRLNLSYGRAKHIIEQMRVMGIIERSEGHSPHKVTIKQSEVIEYKELLKDMCHGQEPPEHKPDDTRLLRLLSLFNVEADMMVVRRTPTTIILEYSFINEATYRKVKELSTELSMRLNAPSFRIIRGVKYDFGAELANDELHLLKW